MPSKHLYTYQTKVAINDQKTNKTNDRRSTSSVHMHQPFVPTLPWSGVGVGVGVGIGVGVGGVGVGVGVGGGVGDVGGVGVGVGVGGVAALMF